MRNHSYSGQFSLNTDDDAFHSKRDIKILSGKNTIYAKDDGISAKHNLILGKKDASNEDLDLKLLNSYEVLKGMTVKIYSGKIIDTAIDDGINASEEHVEREEVNDQIGIEIKLIEQEEIDQEMTHSDYIT